MSERLTDGLTIELIHQLKDLADDLPWLSEVGQRAVQNMVAAEIDLDNARTRLAAVEAERDGLEQLKPDVGLLQTIDQLLMDMACPWSVDCGHALCNHAYEVQSALHEMMRELAAHDARTKGQDDCATR